MAVQQAEDPHAIAEAYQDRYPDHDLRHLIRQVRQDIRDLQQSLGLTAVYVTHDQEEALHLSDSIVIMDEGRVIQAGSAHDLYFRPTHSEFEPRTLWSLSNAFTSAFKQLDPIPQFKATAKLGWFLQRVQG